MAFVDIAVADAAAKAKADAAAAAAARVERSTALVRSARTAVTPVVTDRNGRVVAPPATLEVAEVDVDAEMVVLATSDGTAFFMVLDGKVYLTQHDDGRWVQGPQVRTLAEAGAALPDFMT